MPSTNNLTKGRVYEFKIREKKLLLWISLYKRLTEIEKLSKKINETEEKEKIKLWNEFHNNYSRFPLKNCNNKKMKSLYFSIFGALKQSLKKQYFDETNFKYSLKINIERLDLKINKLKNNL